MHGRPREPDNRGMGGLPAGTITMLFTDIEGSTALLRRLGELYADALSAQRALLRAAFADSGGQEMGTEGDSFFVVFGSAADAVRCCVAAQRALSGHAWPDGVPVRVRMGLHSGEPTWHEGEYVGLDVHRAARIMAAAHGGQVVLSEATRQLAGSRLPAGASLRDLGLHRLKDIEAPEHIYQLVAGGRPAASAADHRGSRHRQDQARRRTLRPGRVGRWRGAGPAGRVGAAGRGRARLWAFRGRAARSDGMDARRRRYAGHAGSPAPVVRARA